jgi:hypothetical protein
MVNAKCLSDAHDDVFTSRAFHRGAVAYYVGVGGVALAAFLLVVWFTLTIYGVSLDDGYIFFVYARNLAQGHGWSFNPDVTSFGASSITWTLLLALPAAFNADLVQASRLLSGLFFGGSAILLSFIILELTDNRILALLSAVVYVTTPSLLLISLTGMEVTSHIFFLLLLTYCLARWELQRPILVGALAGILFLSRPDAAIVIPLLFACWLIKSLLLDKSVAKVFRQLPRQWLPLCLAALIVVLPWLLYLYAHTGRLVPLSYDAKLLSMPGAPETLKYTLAQRFDVAIEYLWKGLQEMLLESGAFASLPLRVLVAIWIVATLVYALFYNRWRSPDSSKTPLFLYLFMFGLFILVPFEYGWRSSWWYGGYLYRYILPVLPFCQLLTTVGIYPLFVLIDRAVTERSASTTQISERRSISSGRKYVTWLAYAMLMITVAWSCRDFVRAFPTHTENYRAIVTLNENYRRSVAEWLRLNTPPNAYIGENYLGVGAIGYYAQRHIVDAGGLAETRIIEFWNRDGNPAASMPETFAYFDSVGVAYFVAAPGLEKQLPTKVEPAVTIHNQAGNLSWDEYDFNTVAIYRYH